MKKLESTRTKLYSYRAKWFFYRRVCKKLNMEYLEEKQRIAINKEYDLLLLEELLEGKKSHIFHGLGVIFLKGVYIQLKNEDGSPRVTIDRMLTNYNPIYDEDGNKLPQYGIAEYWDYFIQWSRPTTKAFQRVKCEMNPHVIKARLTALKAIDSPILYKLKENNRKYGV